MKENRALRLIGSVCLVLVLLIFPFTVAFSATTQTPSATSGYTVTLKVSHGQAAKEEYSDKHGHATRFKKLVESQTNGAVKVEIYPLGQLYSDKDSVMAVADGTIFGSILGSDVAPFWVKSLYIFQFPGLFMSKSALQSFLDSEKGGKVINEDLMKSGLFPAWWHSGPLHFFTVKKPLTGLADAKGLKIRCNDSEILNKTIQALSASAVNMSSSEMYTAIQTGMIDGAFTGLQAVTARKLQEVLHYCLNDPMPYYNESLSIASMKILDKMPGNVRKIVQDAWVSTAKQHGDIDMETGNAEALKAMAASGMKFTSLDPASKATLVNTWKSQASSYGEKYGITPLYNEAVRLLK
jgi:TRAP-type C4-dicarboxylate transport system substrate-binding protein